MFRVSETSRLAAHSAALSAARALTHSYLPDIPFFPKPTMQDAACAADIVGMTYNPGCVPVPANGTYPGDYFMAECTEEAVEEESSDDSEEEDADAASGAASFFRFGFASRTLVSSGVVAAASLTAAVSGFL